MYSLGEKVAQSDKDAFKWYRKSAAQGYAISQNNLGNMYAKGRGVPRNNKEALKWWEKSAKQGVDTAQLNLGRYYENGYGVEKDIVTAHMFYNLAVVNGHTTAKFQRDMIAKEMTREQIGKAQDLAREWLKSQTVKKISKYQMPFNQ